MIMRPFLMLALLRLSCHGYGYGAHDHHPLWGKAVRVRPDAIQSEPNRQRPGLFFGTFYWPTRDWRDWVSGGPSPKSSNKLIFNASDFS
uniref:Secreted peptide n=1 Tax=Anopheles braziliensis TaxID=58242 RepID=A0A2M3ZM79_9DIPT